jgi:hypothetical protein
MWLEGLSKLKKSNDLIRIRTRDLQACNIVPKPTRLPRAPHSNSNSNRNDKNNHMEDGSEEDF